MKRERNLDQAGSQHADLDLARACADGEEAAWKEFEARHFGYIRSFARRFGLPEETAADVADGVIADLWQRRKISSFEGRSTLRTWLGAVVTHAALNAATRERRRVSIDGAERSSSPVGISEDAIPAVALDPPASPGLDDPVARKKLSDAVASALRGLDPQRRLLLLLYYEQGLTLAEIGGLMGTSKATMSRRLEKIRRDLQRGIEHELAAEGTTWGEIRAGIDLSRLDLDLPVLLRS